MDIFEIVQHLGLWSNAFKTTDYEIQPGIHIHNGLVLCLESVHGGCYQCYPVWLLVSAEIMLVERLELELVGVTTMLESYLPVCVCVYVLQNAWD